MAKSSSKESGKSYALSSRTKWSSQESVSQRIIKEAQERGKQKAEAIIKEITASGLAASEQRKREFDLLRSASEIAKAETTHKMYESMVKNWSANYNREMTDEDRRRAKQSAEIAGNEKAAEVLKRGYPGEYDPITRHKGG